MAGIVPGRQTRLLADAGVLIIHQTRPSHTGEKNHHVELAAQYICSLIDDLPLGLLRCHVNQANLVSAIGRYAKTMQ